MQARACVERSVRTGPGRACLLVSCRVLLFLLCLNLSLRIQDVKYIYYFDDYLHRMAGGETDKSATMRPMPFLSFPA